MFLHQDQAEIAEKGIYVMFRLQTRLDELHKMHILIRLSLEVCETKWQSHIEEQLSLNVKRADETKCSRGILLLDY